MAPRSSNRTTTDPSAGAGERRRRVPSLQTALTTAASLLVLPILLLVLPQLSLHGSQTFSTRPGGAPVPASRARAAAAGSVLPPAPRATATAAAARPAPSPAAVSPAVANVEQGREVCAGTRHEDALGQPILAPVDAVLIVGPEYWDAGHPPPRVPCTEL